jgi:hypothetical protein
METRNILAHQGTQSDADSIDQFYDILIALSYSIAWVLRTVLLVEAGFDAATLQEAYRCSSAYNHHITTREICAAAALTLPPRRHHPSNAVLQALLASRFGGRYQCAWPIDSARTATPSSNLPARPAGTNLVDGQIP